eukprot:GSMAST32.ASY1.ANO1.1435.1 assembled CDS
MFTGGQTNSTETLPHKSKFKILFRTCKDKVPDDLLFQTLQNYLNKRAVIGCTTCGISSGKEERDEKVGLVAGHAYSLLQCRVCCTLFKVFYFIFKDSLRTKKYDLYDLDGLTKLVQLRNPWGSFEWKGDWSDKDVERWEKHPKIRRQLGYKRGGSNDGRFWMRYSDFLTYFTTIHVCDRSININSIQLSVSEQMGCCGIFCTFFFE